MQHEYLHEPTKRLAKLLDFGLFGLHHSCPVAVMLQWVTSCAATLRNSAIITCVCKAFVIGAGSTYSVDSTGGAASYSITASAPTITTTARMCQAGGGLGSYTVVGSVSASGGGGSQTVGLQPYYALAYIHAYIIKL